MNHSIRHLPSSSQRIHQHAAWRPLHTCELGQSCRGTVVRLSLSRAEVARLWNKVIRSKWLSCTATSCDFKTHKCIQMTQLVLQRWQSITITTKSLESIRARRLPHQCPQTSAKFGGTLSRWALPKYTVHFPLRVREPQPASHKPCSWMLLGEKDAEEGGTATPRLHTRSRKIRGLSFLSTALQYLLTLNFTQRSYEWVWDLPVPARGHYVSLMKQGYSASLTSSPKVKLQKHSETARTIFVLTELSSHRTWFYFACYFSYYSVFRLTEVILSGSQFRLCQGQNISIKIDGRMLYISSNSRIKRNKQSTWRGFLMLF